MKIDNNYRIDTDGAGCTLIFSETRQRKKKDTGEKEDYIFEDQWYFGTVRQCLNKYIDLVQERASNVDECIKLTEEAAITIKGLFSKTVTN